MMFKSSTFAILLAVSGLACASTWQDAPVVDASAEFEVEQDIVNQPETPVLEAPADSGDGWDASQAEGNQSSHSTPDFPVEANYATQPRIALSTAEMSEAQRLALVERQLNNIASMNFAEQINILQQEIAQLRGQLEVEQHDVKLLNQQIKNFYQDLDSRLSGKSASSTAAAVKKTDAPVNQAVKETQVQLQESGDYQAAFTALSKRSYTNAKNKFLRYLEDHPKGKYVADANYWLGEIYMIYKDDSSAQKAFETVINQYPKSSKAVDAQLKVAIIHANAGQLDQAKTELRSITQKHPNSAVAQLANIRLQQLGQS